MRGKHRASYPRKRSSQSTESNRHARGYGPRRCPAPTANAVPPRGIEPLPTTFALSCPILGTVAYLLLEPEAPGSCSLREPEASLKRLVAVEGFEPFVRSRLTNGSRRC